ncbi:hypothetical protein MMC09_003281 [Bachmanniomyces sp. S44760]|nr:hypothetical protein [Bachmanniomyces sp. S44760]
MNPFRSRKKSVGEESGGRRPSTDSEVPPMPSFASRARTFRRGKKAQPEPKPQINIAAALPSSDDFRTSLLMPNLSARFSMLREQDDPNSKIGKANDDSVLFPKRASRLNLFGQTSQLSDIAEVSSLAGSIRAPFAHGGRTASYASMDDGYGTDEDSRNGSVIGRARPGEGNKFFGGRQKIYKIPVGEAAPWTHTGPGTPEQESGKGIVGKAVYEEDVPMSEFQILRQKEREANHEPESPVHDETERPRSPLPSGYNRNRETGSSTNSAPSYPRSSTAATSVASQSGGSLYGQNGHAIPGVPSSKQSPMERNGTKTKRLYGQGLDQQMYDQQSSAMHRLDSIQRQRVHGGMPSHKNLSHSKSATNLNDRFQRPGGPLYASNNFRAGSPPPPAPSPALAAFDLGLNEKPPSIGSRDDEPGFGRSPPLSPPMSPGPDPSPFVAALEPNDIGKATASGAFARPARQYDEEQYALRQRRLQEGRDTPDIGRSSESAQGFYLDQQPSRRDESESLPPQKHQSPQQMSDHTLSAVPEGVNSNDPSIPASPEMNETFFTGASNSEAGTDTEASQVSPPVLQPFKYQNFSQVAKDAGNLSSYPHNDQHPAVSQSKMERSFMDLTQSPVDRNNPTDAGVEQTTQKPDNSPISDKRSNAEPDSSPTLGPQKDLSGLVRAHLRNDSGASSVYPADSPGLNNRYSTASRKSKRGEDNGGTFLNSSFDDNDWNGEHSQGAAPSHVQDAPPMPPPLSLRARQILEQATALRDDPADGRGDKAQRILGSEAPRRSEESSTTQHWQEQIRAAHHVRGGSTETQKEREDLATELAERRKRIEDSVKYNIETESRSSSPTPGSRGSEEGYSKSNGPFGLLKKASRGSLVRRQEDPSKAMRMLGMTSSPNMKGASPQPSQDQLHKDDSPTHSMSEFKDSLVGLGLSDNRPQPQQSPRQAQFGTFRQRAQSSDRNRANAPRHSPPSSTMPLQRGRADSTTSNSRAHTPNGFHRPHHQRPLPPPDARMEARNESRNGYRNAPRDARMEPRSDSRNGPRNESRNGHRYDGPQTRQPGGMTRPSPGGSPPQGASRPGPRGSPPQGMPSERSQSAMSGRMRNGSKSAHQEYFEQKGLHPIKTSYPAPIGLNPRPSPFAPHSAQPVSSLPSPSPMESPIKSTASTPTMIPAHGSGFPTTNRVPTSRKRSVNKHDISEPTFVSATSSVSTVNLPPGASLSNGMDRVNQANVPPVPPLNPRRKKPKPTANVFTAFGRPGPTQSNSDHGPQWLHGSQSGTPLQSPSFPLSHSMRNLAGNNDDAEVMSTFSADEDAEDEPVSKPSKTSAFRHRLRKTSSEGGNLNAKARQHAMNAPGPAVPSALILESQQQQQQQQAQRSQSHSLATGQPLSPMQQKQQQEQHAQRSQSHSLATGHPLSPVDQAQRSQSTSHYVPRHHHHHGGQQHGHYQPIGAPPNMPLGAPPNVPPMAMVQQQGMF